MGQGFCWAPQHTALSFPASDIWGLLPRVLRPLRTRLLAVILVRSARHAGEEGCSCILKPGISYLLSKNLNNTALSFLELRMPPYAHACPARGDPPYSSVLCTTKHYLIRFPTVPGLIEHLSLSVSTPLEASAVSLTRLTPGRSVCPTDGWY